MTLIASMFFSLLWSRLFDAFKYLGLVTYFIFIVSYIYTAFSNPGIPKKNLWINKNVVYNNIRNFRICPSCQVIMNIDENTSHCDDCDICVEGIN